MTTPTLPAYVDILFDSYQQVQDSGILRTDFELGLPRQAKFKSRVLKTRQAKLYINSKANFLLFEDWFANDLEQGALFFNMTDPVTQNTISARFVGGGYTARPMTAAMDFWEVEIQIESWG